MLVWRRAYPLKRNKRGGIAIAKIFIIGFRPVRSLCMGSGAFLCARRKRGFLRFNYDLVPQAIT